MLSSRSEDVTPASSVTLPRELQTAISAPSVLRGEDEEDQVILELAASQRRETISPSCQHSSSPKPERSKRLMMFDFLAT